MGACRCSGLHLKVENRRSSILFTVAHSSIDLGWVDFDLFVAWADNPIWNEAKSVAGNHWCDCGHVLPF